MMYGPVLEFVWNSNRHRLRSVVFGLVIVGRRQWAKKQLEGMWLLIGANPGA